MHYNDDTSSTKGESSPLRTAIIAILAVVLVAFSVSPVAAQSPAAALEQGAGGQLRLSQAPAPGPIDPERLRQIGSERTRQFLLGAGLMAAGGAVGFSKQNWVIEEGVLGIAIAALGLAAIIEPVTWRELEVRTSVNGLSLAW